MCQAIAASAPGFTLPQKILLLAAEVLRIGLLIGRKIRVIRNKDNVVPLALGGALDLVVGSRPSIQHIAKIVFGSLSILRCVEDLIEIKRLAIKIIRCFRGNEYVTVKRDQWIPLKGRIQTHLNEKKHWIQYFYIEQIKTAFRAIAQLFKRVFLLSLHLTDVYSAYKEQQVSEMFVYGKDIWNSLTSKEAILVKELERTRSITNWMLSKTGSAWTTDFLLSAFLLPAQLQQKLPDIRDIKDSATTQIEDTAIRIDAIGELLKTQYKNVLDHLDMTKNLPSFLVPSQERNYLIFKKGDSNDPDKMRFMDPPDIKPFYAGLKPKVFN